MAENFLCYGDNLDVLRRHVEDEWVDLVYPDPPFKSNQDSNVLFAEKDGTRAVAQIRAFEDTWRWDTAARTTYQEFVEAGGTVSQALKGFRTVLGTITRTTPAAGTATQATRSRHHATTIAFHQSHCILKVGIKRLEPSTLRRT